MTYTGHELIVTVAQPAPDAGAVSDGGTGGTWPASAVSFKVVAWYVSGEAQEDNAGMNRSTEAAFANYTPTLNHKVTLTWTAASIPPDHYSVYWVPGTTFTFNGTVIGRKCAQVDGHVLTATITNPYNDAATCGAGGSETVCICPGENFLTTLSAGDKVVKNDGNYATIVTVDSDTQFTSTALTNSATYSNGNTIQVFDNILIGAASDTTFVINPVQDITMNVRPQTVRGFNGRLVQKSYAQISPLLGLRIDFLPISISQENYNKICRYIVQGVRCTVEEPDEAEPIITAMAGKFVNASHLPSRYKSTRQMMSVDYECEIGTIG